MLAAPSYRDLIQQLSNRFKTGYANSESVRMVGILLCRPGSFVQTKVFDSLDYFDIRSGNHIDFFFSGYQSYRLEETPKEWRVAYKGATEQWTFDANYFNSLRDTLEQLTSWKYSGNAELLLLNSRFNGKAAELDFSSCITIDLDQVISNGGFTIEKLFENIFRFAEGHDGTDPTWGFSDRMGINIGGQLFKSILLSILPSDWKPEVIRALDFAIRNVQKK